MYLIFIFILLTIATTIQAQNQPGPEFGQTGEQYAGENTFVDNNGVTRTNDPYWYCGSVNALGEFKMDAKGSPPVSGESCRRYCESNSDCYFGMTCHLGNGAGDFLSTMLPPFGRYCKCTSDLHCGLGQVCSKFLKLR
jgi:hypothetical protein